MMNFIDANTRLSLKKSEQIFNYIPKLFNHNLDYIFSTKEKVSSCK